MSLGEYFPMFQATTIVRNVGEYSHKTTYSNRRKHQLLSALQFLEVLELHGTYCDKHLSSLPPYQGARDGRSWLRHCTTSRKVAGSIPEGVKGIFY
jgi:hypothetical protein